MERRGDPPPPDNWCSPITMPSSLPFTFNQPAWWDEFFSFSVTQTGKVTFKVYPDIKIDSALIMMWAFSVCPTLGDTYIWAPYGPASVTINATAGNLIVLLARLQGGNYTIFGCNGVCGDVCPNDCGANGFCQVKTGVCLCDFGYEGPSCALACNVTECCLSSDPNPNCCNPSLCCVGNSTDDNPNCQPNSGNHGPPFFHTWGQFLGLVGGLGGFLILVVGAASLILYYNFKNKNNANGKNGKHNGTSLSNHNGYHPLPTTLS